MNGLLVPGSLALLQGLSAKYLCKSGYHDAGFLVYATTALTGYFMIYDYRRRSNPDYKKNLIAERKKTFDKNNERPITAYLQAHLAQYKSLNMLKHPMYSQQLLMQEIQRGEMGLQQGNIEIALEKFGIAAALSYCAGGEAKGQKLIETIGGMLPQVLDKLVSNFKKDMVAVDNFVAENQPEPPKLQSRDDFLKNLSKPKQQAVVEEVLEEDSIDEDSEDEKEKESPAPEPKPEPVEEIKAVAAETVAAEPVPVPEIQANEESQDQSAQILEDVETEALNSNAFSTPEVLSGSDFNQEEVSGEKPETEPVVIESEETTPELTEPDVVEPVVEAPEVVTQPAQVFITQEPEQNEVESEAVEEKTVLSEPVAENDPEVVVPDIVESNIANVESEGEISEEEIVMSPQEDAGDAILSSPKMTKYTVNGATTEFGGDEVEDEELG